MAGGVTQAPRGDLRVVRSVGHREDQRSRLVGFVDDLGDLQFKDVVAEWLVSNCLGQDPSSLPS
ncbi:Uncharacterised protein [Mycobacterium tuberculosis]|nr:Uncharacterised protein [Mycobacterium tuberculosis]COY17061.1 Uncharacterised protein [Mycobacterium tuberculosis]